MKSWNLFRYNRESTSNQKPDSKEIHLDKMPAGPNRCASPPANSRRLSSSSNSQSCRHARFREGRAKLALIRQTTIFASQNSHSKKIVFPQTSSGKAAAEWQRQFFFELPQNVPGCSRLRDQGKPLESNQPGEGGDQEDEIESADAEHMY